MMKYYILFLMILFPLIANANHLIGYDIQTEPTTLYIAGVEYTQVKVRLYRNCATSTRFTNNITLTLAGYTDTTCNMVRSAHLSGTRTLNESCSGIDDCIGNAVEEGTYLLTIMSSQLCDSMLLVTNEQCCRLNTISNIENPSNSKIVIRGLIKINNISPIFENTPWVTACAGKEISFAQEIKEIEGDSLHFELISSSYDAFTNVTYNSGYSYLQPLLTDNGVSINENTGLITFKPLQGIAQNAILTIRISEYRNGKLIGFQDREIYFSIEPNCNNQVPALVEIRRDNQVVNVNQPFYVCDGQAINLSLKVEDLDWTQIVNLQDNFSMYFPDVQITRVGSNPAFYNVTIPANNIVNNSYIITLKVRDNHCPIVASSYYTLNFLKGGAPVRANAICRGTNAVVSLTDNYVTYQWSTGATTATILYDGLSSDYSVTVTDLNACVSNYNFPIQFAEPIVFSLQTQEVDCNNLGAIFINNNGNLYTYTLNGSNPQNNNIFENLNEGSFALRVIDNNGCYVDSLVSINTAPLRNIVPLSIDSLLCLGTTATLGFSENYSNYQWSNQQTTANITTDGNSDIYSVNFTDLDGCQRDYTFYLNYTDALEFDVEVVENLCKNDLLGEIILSPINSNHNNYSYVINSSINSATNIPHFKNLPAGIYSITATENISNCTSIISVNVTEPPHLVIMAEGIGNTCQGFKDAKIQLHAEGGTVINSPYQYSLDKRSWHTNTTFEQLLAGAYMVYVRDNNKCLDSMPITLSDAPPFFMVAVQQDTTIVYGNTVNLFVALNNSNEVYSEAWYNMVSNQIINENTNNITVNPYSTTPYKYVVKSQTACQLDTTIYVKVLTPRHANAPNGFTPNGDYKNDKFFIQGNENMVVKVKTFRVYDRWGELLFENNNIPINAPQYGWDGTFKGKEMPSGVFAWYADVEFIDGIVKSIKGDVTLMR